MKTSCRWKLKKTAMGNYILYKKFLWWWQYVGYYANNENMKEIIANLEYEEIL